MASPTQASYGNQAIVVLGIAVGFFVVPVLAKVSPELVNGVLALILIGVILMHSDQWLPLLNQFGGAVSIQPSKRPYPAQV